MLNCSLISFATETSEQETNESTEETVEYFGWEEDPYDRLALDLESDTVELASSYDPRDYTYLTDTRNQNPHGLCWMYGSVGAVEQYTSKNYGTKFDISEVHGAVALSKSIIPTGSTGDGYYKNNSDMGSNFSTAFQYLTNWNTPIFNEDTCYWQSCVPEEEYPKSILSANQSAVINDTFTDSQSLLNVTGIKYINKTESNIKYAIKNYGAVTTDIQFGISLLNADSNGDANCFSGEVSTMPNHCLVIVGWDDNYSRDNFSENRKPSTDGAWLVRNSWSNSNYIWVPYTEGSFKYEACHMAVVTGIQKSSDNEHMLSYDYLNIGSKEEKTISDTLYLCNLFDVSELTDEYEKITKVMLFLKTTGCTYKIKIVQLDENNNLPINLNSYSALATGTFKGEGYFTVDLEQDYVFTSNNKCAVIAELIPENSSTEIYIPTESSSGANSGESLFGLEDNSSNIIWTDCTTSNEYNTTGNLCIRPVLRKRTESVHEITISPTEIEDKNTDTEIQINSDSHLFNIHTVSNTILVENVDYTRTETGIILKQEYINSLNGNYTELVLEFSNDISKTIVVNPKATITNITLTGDPIIGDTITATCVGIPEKDTYDVTYQWQSSLYGDTWYDISGATECSYVVAENVHNMYLRVKVTSIRFGNVVYPSEAYSNSTSCKTVILGDVDLDGIVSIKDSTAIQRYISNSSVNFTSEQFLAADINKDGIVNIKDATEIQRLLIS